jgi:hypothetical protein
MRSTIHLRCLVGFSTLAAIFAKAAYFGFYSANLTSNAPYSNLFQADTISDALTAETSGQHSLLLTYSAFFVSAPNRLVLAPDFEARWAALAALSAPLIANGTLLGFNMGDELVWNCLAPTNLTIAANTIRATFPRGSAILWYNEATVSEGSAKTPHFNLRLIFSVLLFCLLGYV